VHPPRIEANDVGQIRDEYRRLAVAWQHAHGNPREANELFTDHHRFYKAVRDREEGRTAIAELMDDTNDAVRLLAATHCLVWSQDRALEVLRELEAQPGPYGLDARYKLKGFLAGDLNLDW
jgi:hypothetical protein